MLGSGLDILASVSYTHLDVYKRQVLANFTPAQGAGAELMATFNVILDLTPHG